MYVILDVYVLLLFDYVDLKFNISEKFLFFNLLLLKLILLILKFLYYFFLKNVKLLFI